MPRHPLPAIALAAALVTTSGLVATPAGQTFGVEPDGLKSGEIYGRPTDPALLKEFLEYTGQK